MVHTVEDLSVHFIGLNTTTNHYPSKLITTIIELPPNRKTVGITQTNQENLEKIEKPYSCITVYIRIRNYSDPNILRIYLNSHNSVETRILPYDPMN